MIRKLTDKIDELMKTVVSLQDSKAKLVEEHKQEEIERNRNQFLHKAATLQ